MLREYEGIMPGFSAEVLAMAKRQESHRQELEMMTAKGNERRANWGIWVGAGLSGLCIVAALLLGLSGDQATASVLGGADIVGLAAVFVTGRWSQRSERLERAKIMAQAQAPQS